MDGTAGSASGSVENDLSLLSLLISDVISVQLCRLEIIHYSVQGLLSKAFELQEWLDNGVVFSKIFCFRETWMSSALPYSKFWVMK